MASIHINLALKDLQCLSNGLTIKIDDSVLQTAYANTTGDMLFNFMHLMIKELNSRGNVRTAETYRSTMNSFMNYTKKDIAINDIDRTLMKGYENFLMDKGVKWNTISFYMRILRAVYNKAVDYGITIDKNPFKTVYTGIDKTKKRAVSIGIMQMIRNYDIKQIDMEFARDMFLFSFYAHGMSFVDMAYLKFSNINNGVLSYKRKKTGQVITMEWTKELTDITMKWPSQNNIYILPIINKINGKERNQFRYIQGKVNKELKNLGLLLNLEDNLTMYVARHSWASIAQKLNIPIEVISQGMGHDSVRTTRIYLKGIETNEIDKANLKIIEAINK